VCILLRALVLVALVWYPSAAHAQTTYFSDNLEGGAGEWDSVGSPWALTTESSSSATTAWSDSPGGVYGPNVNASIYTRPINLAGSVLANLRFNFRRDLAAGDQLAIWVTTDGGATHDYLGGFIGVGGWSSAFFDLSAYNSSTSVQIVFQLVTDAAGAADGVYIDDIVVGQTTPTPFGKFHPEDHATGLPTNPTLVWFFSSVGGNTATYEYCLDTIDNDTCDSGWITHTTANAVAVSGLSEGTAYYWQVRSSSAAGTTYADGSPTAFRRFTTALTGEPSPFTKSSPGYDAAGVSTSPTLSWTTNLNLPQNATEFQYCVDTVRTGSCQTGVGPGWTSVGLNKSAQVVGLSPGTTYYWQVRALNGVGTAYANGYNQNSGSAVWAFITAGVGQPPGAFGKSAPGDGATGQSPTPTLSWAASSGATSYEYCLDLTINSTCDGAWTSAGSATSVGVTGLAPGTTYSWHVRALNGLGTTYADAGAGAFWSFTVRPPGAVSGDFTGDGLPELVFQNSEGKVFAWVMSGLSYASGTWLAQDIVGPDWKIVGTSDLTGDAQVDLLWQHQTSGEVILQGFNGTTRVSGQVIPVAPNTPWRIRATGDVNGDGRADLVWQNDTTGQIYIWFMSATGGVAQFASGAFVTAADLSPMTLNPTARTEWRIAGSGDFNADGQLDLVWRNLVSGATAVWTLQGNVFTGSLNYGAVSLAWQLRAVGDYYGDAAPDLVWQHTGTGQLYLWVRQAGALLPGTGLGSTNPIWSVVGAR
jgi:hypothetical protein